MWNLVQLSKFKTIISKTIVQSYCNSDIWCDPPTKIQNNHDTEESLCHDGSIVLGCSIPIIFSDPREAKALLATKNPWESFECCYSCMFYPPSSKKTSIQNIRIPVRQTSENIQLKKQESVQITIIIFLPQFRRFLLGWPRQWIPEATNQTYTPKNTKA